MGKLSLAGLAFCIGGVFLSASGVHSEIGKSPSDGGQAHAAGMLEGVVTLICLEDTVGCSERPYQVPLLMVPQWAGMLPQQVLVSAAGKFSASLPAGLYLIASGDTRGACCLPVLEPIPVEVVAGRTTNVQVRFRPGLQLPTR
jgi:hypothetical protein